MRRPISADIFSIWEGWGRGGIGSENMARPFQTYVGKRRKVTMAPMSYGPMRGFAG